MPLLRPRKKTTRSSRPNRTIRRGGDIQKLHIKVSSPRIVMIEIMRGVNRAFKLAMMIALLGFIGWGGYKGVKHVFIDNEKYRLQEINLQTNGHLDHARVVEVAGIDLKASIFAADAEEIRDRLNALPEVINSSVKRRLPGTLKIDITERVPVVWLKCEKLAYPGRQDGGVLVDKDGITFPCEGALWQTAKDLPVIEVMDADTENFTHGSKMKHKDAMRALRLVQLFNQRDVKHDWSPERVVLLNNYSMEAVCNDGTHAVFGMYDHERQLGDFLKISERVRETERLIRHINLIPTKNIPVKFAARAVLVQP